MKLYIDIIGGNLQADKAGMGALDLCPSDEVRQKFGSRMLVEAVGGAFDDGADSVPDAPRKSKKSSFAL